MIGSTLARLAARRAAVGTRLCLGIDPHPDQLPAGLTTDARGIEHFARGLIEAAAPEACAVKINVAFFEAFGADGWAALERVRRDVPSEIVCILDAKRGDIGSTAERYAESLFGRLQADAVTLSPYLGEDAVDPFLADVDRMVYLLARTSNPSAGTIQELVADGSPVHLHVALWAADRWPDGRVGLVVGATAPAELASVRAAVPGPGFLVPGVGAQGGDLDAAHAQRGRELGAGPDIGLALHRRRLARARLARGGRRGRQAMADRMRDTVLHSKASSAAAANHGGS